MLSLYLMSVVEPGVLIEISVNLLDLGDFPAVVLLSLRPIRFLPCLYLRIPPQCDFPRGTVDLLSQPLPRLLVVIPVLIAVKLFPSFSLGSCQNHRFLCKNTSTSCMIIVQVTQEHTVGAHVLRFIKRVYSLELAV